MKFTARRSLLRLGLTLGIIVAVAGGYYVMRYQVWTAYRNWSIARMNSLTREFIATGDSRNALLTVRQVLRKRPNDPTAWRLGVQAAALGSSPEVVIFQRNLCRVEPTTANYLELMRLAVKYHAYQFAAEAIPAVTADAAAIPEFHRLAADASRHLHRDVAAKYHLLSLLSLVPDDREAQLALAETEFQIDAGHLPADWGHRVGQLVDDPLVGARAMILALRDAVNRRDVAATRRWFAVLSARPGLDVEQQLRMLAAAWLVAPAEADPRLAALQLQVATQPESVIQVMDFLTTNGRAGVVRTWYPSLAAAVREDERVKLALAGALDELADWKGVEQLLAGAKWKTNDALRLGFLARSYRMSGQPGVAAESWKLAVVATGQDVSQAARLLRHVEAWHWDEERYDLWWRLFNITGAAEVREPLIAHEVHAGNTVNLNKIFARMMESDPANEVARNNFAYTSLLLGTNPGRAHLIAQSLYREHPDNPTYRSTYALALFRQGRFTDALALLDSLPAAVRGRPGVVLPAAISAAAGGEPGRAANLLAEIDSAGLLPEERQLVAAAREQVVQGETSRRQLLPAEMDSVAKAGGWLVLVPDRGRDVPASWRAADANYRDRDFPGLEKVLASGTWPAAEHLRYALWAYAERAQNHNREADDRWRQASAAAGRDPTRLRELEALCAQWNWPAERIEVMDRRFEREPADAALLAGLVDYYRRNGRTADLARVFWLYVNQANPDGSEVAWCVYYSLLCGSNLSAAQTLAARAYSAAPDDPRRRVAYAFSLWRQGRAAEAVALLQDPSVQNLADMQVGLVEAGALLQLGRTGDARARLTRFSGVPAMPEEVALALSLFRQAGLPAPAMAMNGR